MKQVLVLIFLLGVLPIPSQADSQPLENFELKVGSGKFWDYGWGSKFFFQTGRWNGQSEGFPSWYRILDHESLPNLELRWSSSARFGWFVSLKYQYIGFTLRDANTVFSFLNWHKKLEADLHFASVGIGVEVPYEVDLNLGADIGYCIANLTTHQIFEVSDLVNYNAEVSGRGGGPFFRWVLGASKSICCGFEVFVDAGYLLCTNWEPIPAKRAKKEIELLNPEAEESDFNHLLLSDRQIGRMHGLQLSLGIGFRF